MGYQSTVQISRQEAIDRIQDIHHLIVCKRYKDLVDNSFETDYSVKKYVEDYVPIDIGLVHQWSTDMIADQMNEPYFRRSLFDNYIVYEDVW